jgi:hypothetical protein
MPAPHYKWDTFAVACRITANHLQTVPICGSRLYGPLEPFLQISTGDFPIAGYFGSPDGHETLR